MTEVQAALLDKDGTLLDFQKTWAPALGRTLHSSGVTTADTEKAAELLRFDLEHDVILPGSPFLSEPNAVIESLVEERLDLDRYRAMLGSAEPIVAPDATEVLETLLGDGLVLALVTNAELAPTRRQLAVLGWESHFAAVIASDSGFGAKPSARPLEHALHQIAVDASRAVMVGDTSHDIEAASVTSILVSNSTAPSQQLINQADHHIRDIASLPVLLRDLADSPRQEIVQP